MCESNQSRYFKPVTQDLGKLLNPTLQPNNAPATAQLVSASPAYKKHATYKEIAISTYCN